MEKSEDCCPGYKVEVHYDEPEPVADHVKAWGRMPVGVPKVVSRDELPPGLAASMDRVVPGAVLFAVIRSHGANVLVYPEGTDDYANRDVIGAEMRRCEAYVKRLAAERRG